MTSILPHQLTTFVGREHQVAEVCALLARDDVRLLTLTGPGGVGKTRLALKIAEEITPAFDAVWFVELASVRDQGLVASTIAGGIGVVQNPARIVEHDLAAHLRDMHALLILDNFEQVVEASTIAIRLLSACPNLRILVTSRINLRLSAEHIYAVPQLVLPERVPSHDITQFQDNESVRLFVDRARARSSSFALTPHNARAVLELCHRLDGLPLAIELAAARANVFSPADLLSRMDARLSLLTHGARDQPLRLQSLRASIAWSYDLLTPAEQTLFRRLGVFPGPWTLDAAEAVVFDANDRPVLTVMDGIASLIDKNLIRKQVTPNGHSQYLMLETIRQYCLEMLVAEDGEECSTRDLHATFYFTVAERTHWSWIEPLAKGEAQLAQLNLEQHNMRTALQWFEQIGDAESLLRLASALAPLWTLCGHCQEGQRWLERSLGTGCAVTDTTRAKAMAILSWVSSLQGQTTKAYELAEQALAIFRSEQNQIGTVHCLVLSGMAARQLGDFDQAFERQSEALSLLGAVDWYAQRTHNWIITLHAGLGHTALFRGDIPQATTHYNRALDYQTTDGHLPGASHIYGNHVLSGLGDVARAAGDQANAIEHYRNSLDLAWRNHDVRAATYAIGGIAGSLAALGRHADAARLFGASEALHSSYGYRFDHETFNRQRALGLPELWMRETESFGTGQQPHDALWEGRVSRQCCRIKV